MNSEMPMMNLLPGNIKSINSTPGPKAAKSIGVNEPQSTAEEGVAASETQKAREPDSGARFKKILESVVKANKQAADKDSKYGTSSSGQAPDASTGLPVDFNELTAELAALGISPADLGMNASDQAAGGTQAEQASKIIQNAILKISQALNISINQGLGNLQMANPSQNVIDQFADILNALKGIAGLLDDAVKNNQPIEISGKVFDVASASAVEQTIRVETFQMEVGLEMAGISGDVAQSAAQKNNLPGSSGIVTALDPALISMPASQINQALGSALLSNEQTVETLFSKLAGSLKGNAASDKTQIVNKIAALAADADKNAQVETVSDGAIERAQKAPDPGAIDSKVMRTLLKIDATSGATEAGNAAAAKGSEKLDLFKTMKIILAKDLDGSDESGEDKAGAIPAGADTASGTSNSIVSTVELQTPASPRTIEESVMNQLADKVQTAIKTGVTEIRLLLKPESLGEMRVKLTMDGDKVMGKIYVENQQVKHIVESNLQTLKDSLAQHNLQAGSFDVNVGGGEREQLQEMAAMSLKNGSNTGKDRAENPENQGNINDLSTGQETGRRFGTNTIEYFV
ncbi:MAG: flagellar hook-length control protein FliK [Chitinivibrionales bacterium]